MPGNQSEPTPQSNEEKQQQFLQHLRISHFWNHLNPSQLSDQNTFMAGNREDCKMNIEQFKLALMRESFEVEFPYIYERKNGIATLRYNYTNTTAIVFLDGLVLSETNKIDAQLLKQRLNDYFRGAPTQKILFFPCIIDDHFTLLVIQVRLTKNELYVRYIDSLKEGDGSVRPRMQQDKIESQLESLLSAITRQADSYFKGYKLFFVNKAYQKKQRFDADYFGHHNEGALHVIANILSIIGTSIDVDLNTVRFDPSHIINLDSARWKLRQENIHKPTCARVLATIAEESANLEVKQQSAHSEAGSEPPQGVFAAAAAAPIGISQQHKASDLLRFESDNRPAGSQAQQMPPPEANTGRDVPERASTNSLQSKSPKPQRIIIDISQIEKVRKNAKEPKVHPELFWEVDWRGRFGYRIIDEINPFTQEIQEKIPELKLWQALANEAPEHSRGQIHACMWLRVNLVQFFYELYLAENNRHSGVSPNEVYLGDPRIHNTVRINLGFGGGRLQLQHALEHIITFFEKMENTIFWAKTQGKSKLYKLSRAFPPIGFLDLDQVSHYGHSWERERPWKQEHIWYVSGQMDQKIISRLLNGSHEPFALKVRETVTHNSPVGDVDPVTRKRSLHGIRNQINILAAMPQLNALSIKGDFEVLFCVLTQMPLLRVLDFELVTANSTVLNQQYWAEVIKMAFRENHTLEDLNFSSYRYDAACLRLLVDGVSESGTLNSLSLSGSSLPYLQPSTFKKLVETPCLHRLTLKFGWDFQPTHLEDNINLLSPLVGKNSNLHEVNFEFDDYYYRRENGTYTIYNPYDAQNKELLQNFLRKFFPLIRSQSLIQFNLYVRSSSYLHNATIAMPLLPEYEALFRRNKWNIENWPLIALLLANLNAFPRGHQYLEASAIPVTRLQKGSYQFKPLASMIMGFLGIENSYPQVESTDYFKYSQLFGDNKIVDILKQKGRKDRWQQQLFPLLACFVLAVTRSNALNPNRTLLFDRKGERSAFMTTMQSTLDGEIKIPKAFAWSSTPTPLSLLEAELVTGWKYPWLGMKGSSHPHQSVLIGPGSKPGYVLLKKVTPTEITLTPEGETYESKEEIVEVSASEVMIGPGESNFPRATKEFWRDDNKFEAVKYSHSRRAMETLETAQHEHEQKVAAAEQAKQKAIEAKQLEIALKKAKIVDQQLKLINNGVEAHKSADYERALQYFREVENFIDEHPNEIPLEKQIMLFIFKAKCQANLTGDYQTSAATSLKAYRLHSQHPVVKNFLVVLAFNHAKIRERFDDWLQKDCIRFFYEILTVDLLYNLSLINEIEVALQIFAKLEKDNFFKQYYLEATHEDSVSGVNAEWRQDAFYTNYALALILQKGKANLPLVEDMLANIKSKKANIFNLRGTIALIKGEESKAKELFDACEDIIFTIKITGDRKAVRCEIYLDRARILDACDMKEKAIKYLDEVISWQEQKEDHKYAFEMCERLRQELDGKAIASPLAVQKQDILCGLNNYLNPVLTFDLDVFDIAFNTLLQSPIYLEDYIVVMELLKAANQPVFDQKTARKYIFSIVATLYPGNFVACEAGITRRYNRKKTKIFEHKEDPVVLEAQKYKQNFTEIPEHALQARVLDFLKLFYTKILSGEQSDLFEPFITEESRVPSLMLWELGWRGYQELRPETALSLAVDSNAPDILSFLLNNNAFDKYLLVADERERELAPRSSFERITVVRRAETNALIRALYKFHADPLDESAYQCVLLLLEAYERNPNLEIKGKPYLDIPFREISLIPGRRRRNIFEYSWFDLITGSSRRDDEVILLKKERLLTRFILLGADPNIDLEMFLAYFSRGPLLIKYLKILLGDFSEASDYEQNHLANVGHITQRSTKLRRCKPQTILAALSYAYSHSQQEAFEYLLIYFEKYYGPVPSQALTAILREVNVYEYCTARYPQETAYILNLMREKGAVPAYQADIDSNESISPSRDSSADRLISSAAPSPQVYKELVAPKPLSLDKSLEEKLGRLFDRLPFSSKEILICFQEEMAAQPSGYGSVDFSFDFASEEDLNIAIDFATLLPADQFTYRRTEYLGSYGIAVTATEEGSKWLQTFIREAIRRSGILIGSSHALVKSYKDKVRTSKLFSFFSPQRHKNLRSEIEKKFLALSRECQKTFHEQLAKQLDNEEKILCLVAPSDSEARQEVKDFIQTMVINSIFIYKDHAINSEGVVTWIVAVNPKKIESLQKFLEATDLEKRRQFPFVHIFMALKNATSQQLGTQLRSELQRIQRRFHFRITSDDHRKFVEFINTLCPSLFSLNAELEDNRYVHFVLSAKPTTVDLFKNIIGVLKNPNVSRRAIEGSQEDQGQAAVRRYR